MTHPHRHPPQTAISSSRVSSSSGSHHSPNLETRCWQVGESRRRYLGVPQEGVLAQAREEGWVLGEGPEWKKLAKAYRKESLRPPGAPIQWGLTS